MFLSPPKYSGGVACAFRDGLSLLNFGVTRVLLFLWGFIIQKLCDSVTWLHAPGKSNEGSEEIMEESINLLWYCIFLLFFFFFCLLYCSYMIFPCNCLIIPIQRLFYVLSNCLHWNSISIFWSISIFDLISSSIIKKTLQFRKYLQSSIYKNKPWEKSSLTGVKQHLF